MEPEDLANTRFALSPIAETLGALLTLGGVNRQPWLSTWTTDHRPAFSVLVRDPVAAALLDLPRVTRYLLDFITPPPTGRNPTFETEIAAMRAAPVDRAGADLLVSAGGRLPPALTTHDVVDRIADPLCAVWTRFLEPDWPRRQAILERDVQQRASRLATYGLAHALDGLGPNVGWRPSGQAGTHHIKRPPHLVDGARLLLVPSSFGCSWLCIDAPNTRWPHNLKRRSLARRPAPPPPRPAATSSMSAAHPARIGQP